MSKEMGLILLGIFVAIVSQLGFPSEMKVIALAVVGLTIAVIGFLLRGETLSRLTDGSESRPTNLRGTMSDSHDAENPTIH